MPVEACSKNRCRVLDVLAGHGAARSRRPNCPLAATLIAPYRPRLPAIRGEKVDRVKEINVGFDLPAASATKRFGRGVDGKSFPLANC